MKEEIVCFIDVIRDIVILPFMFISVMLHLILIGIDYLLGEIGGTETAKLLKIIYFNPK